MPVGPSHSVPVSVTEPRLNPPHGWLDAADAPLRCPSGASAHPADPATPAEGPGPDLPVGGDAQPPARRSIGAPEAARSPPGRAQASAAQPPARQRVKLSPTHQRSKSPPLAGSRSSRHLEAAHEHVRISGAVPSTPPSGAADMSPEVEVEDHGPAPAGGPHDVSDAQRPGRPRQQQQQQQRASAGDAAGGDSQSVPSVERKRSDETDPWGGAPHPSEWEQPAAGSGRSSVSAAPGPARRGPATHSRGGRRPEAGAAPREEQRSSAAPAAGAQPSAGPAPRRADHPAEQPGGVRAGSAGPRRSSSSGSARRSSGGTVMPLPTGSPGTQRSHGLSGSSSGRAASSSPAPAAASSAPARSPPDGQSARSAVPSRSPPDRKPQRSPQRPLPPRTARQQHTLPPTGALQEHLPQSPPLRAQPVPGAAAAGSGAAAAAAPPPGQSAALSLSQHAMHAPAEVVPQGDAESRSPRRALKRPSRRQPSQLAEGGGSPGQRLELLQSSSATFTRRSSRRSVGKGAGSEEGGCCGAADTPEAEPHADAEHARPALSPPRRLPKSPRGRTQKKLESSPQLDPPLDSSGALRNFVPVTPTAMTPASEAEGFDAAAALQSGAAAQGLPADPRIPARPFHAGPAWWPCGCTRSPDPAPPASVRPEGSRSPQPPTGGDPAQDSAALGPEVAATRLLGAPQPGFATAAHPTSPTRARPDQKPLPRRSPPPPAAAGGGSGGGLGAGGGSDGRHSSGRRHSGGGDVGSGRRSGGRSAEGVLPRRSSGSMGSAGEGSGTAHRNSSSSNAGGGAQGARRSRGRDSPGSGGVGTPRRSGGDSGGDGARSGAKDAAPRSPPRPEERPQKSLPGRSSDGRPAAAAAPRHARSPAAAALGLAAGRVGPRGAGAAGPRAGTASGAALLSAALRRAADRRVSRGAPAAAASAAPQRDPAPHLHHPAAQHGGSPEPPAAAPASPSPPGPDGSAQGRRTAGSPGSTPLALRPPRRNRSPGARSPQRWACPEGRSPPRRGQSPAQCRSPAPRRSSPTQRRSPQQRSSPVQCGSPARHSPVPRRSPARTRPDSPPREPSPGRRRPAPAALPSGRLQQVLTELHSPARRRGWIHPPGRSSPSGLPRVFPDPELSPPRQRQSPSPPPESPRRAAPSPQPQKGRPHSPPPRPAPHRLLVHSPPPRPLTAASVGKRASSSAERPAAPWGGGRGDAGAAALRALLQDAALGLLLRRCEAPAVGSRVVHRSGGPVTLTTPAGGLWQLPAGESAEVVHNYGALGLVSLRSPAGGVEAHGLPARDWVPAAAAGPPAVAP
eukprot:TRINITY_DN3960_c1_g1_i7.p1 TRINITY_DN3960_c1_g1~~TRINITY_DN3960_c1_g1_i7.p1  ORF type:complete len:1407 (+),score=159.23 TRINITY_DN3960_c1_g1_i7:319-4221(+)